MELLEVKKERFSLTDSEQYILEGIWPRNFIPEVQVDGRPLKAVIRESNQSNSADRFKVNADGQAQMVVLCVTLPRKINGRRLTVYARRNNKKIVWYRIALSRLKRKREALQFYIEDIQIQKEDHFCRITGWTASQTPIKIRAIDDRGEQLNPLIKRYQRVDVVEVYPECQIDINAGFSLELDNLKTHKIQLIFSEGEKESEYTIHISKFGQMAVRIEAYAKKAIHLIRNRRFRELPVKIMKKMIHRNKPVLYRDWLKKNMPSKMELDSQRKTDFQSKPLFSIVVPLYKTPQVYLMKLIESVQNQTYENWELCLSDGSGEHSPLTAFLKELKDSDERIKIITHQTGKKICENTNAAIGLANGDFVVFADHDDELAPNALFECAKAINENPDIEILYTDEDKVSMKGTRFFEPQMKPDFNLDLLCTVNYICHLFVVKDEIIQKVGLLRTEYEGAQDYDFILRCIEATSEIHHIPKILYHWRSHTNSTSENPESKLYAFEAGRRAVQAHYDRIGIQAVVTNGEYLGLYKTRFIRNYDPLISIIIPNKDHIDDLKRCMDSIIQKSSYGNYEFIIVENNSEKQETFQYYEQLKAENKDVQVVFWKGEFNYSEINNFGAGFANGEYLLLLNNDTEIINHDCLEELLGYCMRPDVGAVGARLYYEDNTIQHAGVVIGFGGIAGHCFVQQPRGASGYCHRIISAQDYSAVTAACMMVKRKAFDEVCGLSRELAVAFNDIDFCLKLRKAGYLIVYNPYAELYHYESKSRGLDDTPEKISRFNKEIKTFENKWIDILKNGDPYYNPNLTLDSQDFSLKG